MIKSTKLNEYGMLVSVHECETCGCEFTMCPAIKDDKNWKHCLSLDCDSYDSERDVDKLFDNNKQKIIKVVAEKTNYC